MTIILTARPAAPVDTLNVKRRYLRRAERLAIVETIAEPFAALGFVTPAMVEEVATRSQCRARHAKRMILEWLEQRAGLAPEPEPKLPFELLVKIAEAQGQVAAGIRAYFGSDEEAAKRLRPSIYRWLDESEPGLLLALKRGTKGLDRYVEVGIWEAEHRNELWLIDETKIPVACRTARNQRIDDLQLLAIFDCYSRLILNAQVTIGAADAVVTAAVVARAALGGGWDGVEYGGRAQASRADNALIFKSEPVKAALRIAGIPPRFARAYTPQDKAKLERWNGTLKTMYLTSFPANTKGPLRHVYVETGELSQNGKPKRERTEIPLHVPLDPAQRPLVEDVAQGIYAAIHDYNANHVHSTTRMTALAKYASDPTPLGRPGIGAFWGLALPVRNEPFIGEGRGVYVDHEWRKPADRPLLGAAWEIRVLPGLDPRYMVGQRGNFVAEVLPTRDEDEDARNARLERNHKRSDRLRAITMIALENSIARAAAAPGTAAYASPNRERGLATSNDSTLASLDAALAVPPRAEGVA